MKCTECGKEYDHGIPLFEFNTISKETAEAFGNVTDPDKVAEKCLRAYTKTTFTNFGVLSV